LHRLRVSVNDEYGFAEQCAKRLELIFAPLDLKPIGDWRASSDAGKGVIMLYYAETFEREYASPIAPEDLKLLLKGTEYAVLPTELQRKIQEDLQLDGVKYVKLCDADVWFRVGKLLMATWDKVTSRSLAKKLGIRDQDLRKMAIEKLKDLLNRAPPKRLEEIRNMELAVLRARNARRPTEI
jgi:hypothetical protein